MRMLPLLLCLLAFVAVPTTADDLSCAASQLADNTVEMICDEGNNAIHYGECYYYTAPAYWTTCADSTNGHVKAATAIARDYAMCYYYTAPAYYLDQCA